MVTTEIQESDEPLLNQWELIRAGLFQSRVKGMIPWWAWHPVCRLTFPSSSLLSILDSEIEDIKDAQEVSLNEYTHHYVAWIDVPSGCLDIFMSLNQEEEDHNTINQSAASIILEYDLTTNEWKDQGLPNSSRDFDFHSQFWGHSINRRGFLMFPSYFRKICLILLRFPLMRWDWRMMIGRMNCEWICLSTRSLSLTCLLLWKGLGKFLHSILQFHLMAVPETAAQEINSWMIWSPSLLIGSFFFWGYSLRGWFSSISIHFSWALCREHIHCHHHSQFSANLHWHSHSTFPLSHPPTHAHCPSPLQTPLPVSWASTPLSLHFIHREDVFESAAWRGC